MNVWLFTIIQAITSVIITFAVIVGMLVMDLGTGMNFVWCFVTGMVLALPVAWAITKRIDWG